MKIKKQPISDRVKKSTFVTVKGYSRLFLLNILIVFSLLACTSHPSSDGRNKTYNGQSRPASYRVTIGDTLFSIAWRYGLKYQDLARYNGISEPYTIHPGQVIRLDMRQDSVRYGASTTTVRPMGTRGNTKSPAVNTQSATINRQKNRTKLTPKINSNDVKWSAPGWRWPVSGPILSSFQGNGGLNKGIDLGGKLGEPVLAAASGQVVYSGSGLRGYGKLLIIKHDETFLSAYAHNHRLLVKEGDVIKAGQKIADMGSSGADRVKLHFEIRRDGTPVDPLTLLPRR